MKSLLFLVLSILLLSFDKIEMKNGFRTAAEKFAGRVGAVTVEEYTAWVSEDGTKYDTLKWSSTHKSTFDKQGVERTEKVYTREGKLVYTDTIKYDKWGNQLERLFIDNNGGVYHEVYNKYDSLGNKIEELEFGQQDKFQTRFVYKYDADGNCIEWKRFNARGRNIGRHNFVYDVHGNNLEEDLLNKKKLVFSYNEKQQLVEARCYQVDKLLYREVNEYDYRGNLAQTLRYAANGHVDEEHSTLYKYEYDKTGNWTRRETQSYEGKSRFLTIRKFEYY